MKIYLVRHGDALPKAVDPQGGLSSEGQDDIGRQAEFLNGAGISVAAVFHSGKRRAAETAELLAESVLPKGEATAVKRLDPLDDPSLIEAEMKNWSGDTMLVGHLPYMSVMASLLVTGSIDHQIVTFESGTVVCLESDGLGQWNIVWMLPPSMLADG